jgi:hypothetical protein
MATNKEITKLASQLSQLAKFYLSNLRGTPADIAKSEKALLNHVRKTHQQLRVKGTALMQGSGSTRTFDSPCSPGVMCDDGSCAPNINCCPITGLMAQPATKAKAKATKPAAKKAAKKKK